VAVWEEVGGAAPRGWRCAARLAGATGAATALAFAPAASGPRLAVASGDGSVRVYVATALMAGCGGSWEAESGVAPDPPRGGPPPRATCLAWRPHNDGAPGADLPAMLAVGGEGGASIWAYRPATGEWARAASLGDAPAAAIAWAPPGAAGAPERVAVACGETVRVWGVRGRADALHAEAPALLPHASPILRLEFAPLGGGWLAAGTAAGRVALWRPALDGRWALQSALAASGGLPPGAVDGAYTAVEV
jgi:WD40 repeat protein